MYQGNAYNEAPPMTRLEVLKLALQEVSIAVALSGAAIPMFVYLLLEAIP
jgi:hypothetical protein